jgi:pyruvate formate lyase activating enzyme
MGILDYFKKKEVQESKKMIDTAAHGLDPLFEDAALVLIKEKYASPSVIQRKLKIGYNRTSYIFNQLVEYGIIGPIIEPMIPQELIVYDEEGLYNLLAPICSSDVPFPKSSILGVSRLRMGTDGNGIRTLVAFHGCTMHCRFCLNPQSLNSEAKVRKMSPEEVMEELKKDELYYIATKGGVTFGGGEPFLNSKFIKKVLDLGAKEWDVAVETSLNVPRAYIEPLLPYIDEYIVDVKDMNDTIYRRYARRSNKLVKSNLKWLIDNGLADNILCRIPLIPGYNDKTHQERSKEELTKMGISRFDLFTYNTDRE